MKILKVLAVFMMAGLFLAGCSDELQVPDQDLDTQHILKGKPGSELDLNGAHFELNLLGKKDGWNDKEVDNPERHTMFVPRNTEGWNIDLKTPNNLGEETLPGVRIDMTQGDEFAVIDGTVFDSDPCEFQLGPGKYQVYVVMRGKNKLPSPQIDGWLEVYDVLDLLWYYQNLGTVTVTRKWKNATDLFMIDESEAGLLPHPGGDVWIFDYMNFLEGLTTWNDEEVSYSDAAYFWQLQNNGSQLIKVRFYPVD